MPENVFKRTATLATLSTLVLAISAPANANEPEATEKSGLPVVAKSETSNSGLGDSYVEVNQVQHSEASGYTVVTWTVHNKGSSNFRTEGLDNEIYKYHSQGVSAATLIDKENNIRYHPIQDAEEVCLCSGTVNYLEFVNKVEPDKSSSYWTSYFLSDETSSVSLEVPDFLPVTGVPVE